MPKYRFKLETLRRLRERHRDEQRSRLADAYRAENLLTEQQKSVFTELAELRSFQRSIIEGQLSKGQLTSEQSTDVNRLVESQRYQLALRAQQDTYEKQAELLTTEVERRRQAVVEADRQVRVLDNLEERQRIQHRLQNQRMETKQLDDMALVRHERSSS